MTVQSTLGVRATYPSASEVVRQTLDCLGDDLKLSAIKIGMLATPANVDCVSEFLASLPREPRIPVVLDPVLRSTSGAELLSEQGIARLKQKLLAQVDWITPNEDELDVLLGNGGPALSDVAVRARAFQSGYPHLGIVVTGGHLDVSRDLVLAPGGSSQWLTGERIESTSTHGTGCAFSSALACGLADGLTPVEAAARAKSFVEEAIRRAPGIGNGRGPMDLYWPLRTAAHP